jgi:4-amino-4-deoxy-L-arabinose transferase-like glycosyltransferase
MARWQRFLFPGIMLLSFLMHLPHLHKDLISIHVWRQTQTQAGVRAFYEEDMNILNPRRDERGDGNGIFRMEFPLMQWSVAAVWKLTGPQLWVSRLFMFLVSCMAALAMLRLLKAITGSFAAGLAGAAGLLFSPAFYYHGFNPMPDNLSLCLSLWGLAFFWQWMDSQRRPQLLAGGLLLAMGVACKLPFIVWYAAPGWYFLRELMSRKQVKETWTNGILFLLPIALPIAWYAWVMPHWNSHVITQGILGNWESLQHTFDYILHNLVSTLPELLVGYALMPLFLLGVWTFFSRRLYRHGYFAFLLVWFLSLTAYYIYEANAIGKDHDYYLYPFYPFVFLPVGLAVKEMLARGGMYRNAVIALFLLLPLTTHLRMQQRWNPEDPGFNVDVLRNKTALQAAVPAQALIVAGNDVSHFIWLYHLDKKGWCFEGDRVSADSLQSWRSRGAAYLYSDSRKLENRPDIAPQLERLLDSFGSLRVYRLKELNQIQSF